MWHVDKRHRPFVAGSPRAPQFSFGPSVYSVMGWWVRCCIAAAVCSRIIPRFALARFLHANSPKPMSPVRSAVQTGSKGLRTASTSCWQNLAQTHERNKYQSETSQHSSTTQSGKLTQVLAFRQSAKSMLSGKMSLPKETCRTSSWACQHAFSEHCRKVPVTACTLRFEILRARATTLAG